MKKNKLFLICPDCHIEHIIQENFKGNVFFLTALASVFDAFEYDYTDHIKEFIKAENIEEIIVLNDCSCRFIKSVLTSEKGYETDAEEVLQVIYSNCQIELLAEKRLNKRAFKLAELNIKQQIQSLHENKHIHECIHNKEFVVKGMIYERDKNSFTEIGIN